ncbi:MAG: cytochrome b562 [Verrucomicrobiota bacterium]
MKKYIHLFCISSILFSAPFAFADGHEESEDTPLEEEMSAMNREWRKVRRAIRDPEKNAETAEIVAKMIKHAKASVDMEPILLAEQKDKAAKKKFMMGYQKAMQQTVDMLGELKAALEAGDNAKANELVGKLNDARKKGHEAYKPEDD